jgi:hypothetical protein
LDSDFYLPSQFYIHPDGIKKQIRQFDTSTQGLEIRGFWVQKKNVQLKTALHEVYTYVLKGFIFQKTV